MLGDRRSTMAVVGDSGMSAAFANPLMYWVGFDLDTEDPVQRDLAVSYYVGTHLPEVVASNPGFVGGHLFLRRDRPDERGGGPAYLAVYEMAGEDAARLYLERNDGPTEGRPRYTPGPPVWQERMTPRWRMVWRRQDGPEPTAGSEVVLIGTDHPVSGGVTYELVRGLLHPLPGAPAHLSVDGSHAPIGNQDVRWRLAYRPIAV
jgi:hypothetical protein